MPAPAEDGCQSFPGQNETSEQTKLAETLVKSDEGQVRRYRESRKIGVLPEFGGVGKALRQSAKDRSSFAKK